LDEVIHYNKMSYCCAYTCAACKIFCYMFCCKCCQKKQIVKEEYTLLALGLSGAGKSTLLSRLCGEDEEDSGPTNGFSMKDVSLTNAILHIKEVGGSESIRRYWHHYFSGSEGLIFVVDGSSSDAELECARSELQTVLLHQDMDQVPLLVLINKVDTDDKENQAKLSGKLDIQSICASRSFMIDAYSLEDVTHMKMLLEKFVSMIAQRANSCNNPNLKEADQDEDVIGRF